MEMVRAPVGLEPTIFGLKSAAVTNLATGARASLTTYRGAMDFSIPADIQALLNECDAFIDDVIVPIEAEDDNIRFFDHRREDARTDWDRDGLPNAEWEALLGRMRREADAAGLLRYQLRLASGPRRLQPGHGDRA